MHSTCGAYNYTYNHKTVMHIQIQALSIIYILSATTPLQIHERVKQDDLSEAICSRFINSHLPPPVLRTCLLLSYWFCIDPLSQPSLYYSSPSWAFALYCGEQSQTWAFGLVLRESHPWQGRTPWGGASGSEVYRWGTCLSMDTKHSHSAWKPLST